MVDLSGARRREMCQLVVDNDDDVGDGWLLDQIATYFGLQGFD